MYLNETPGNKFSSQKFTVVDHKLEKSYTARSTQ